MQKGDKVKVRNITQGGEHIIEGVATLVTRLAKLQPGREKWYVRFPKETTQVARFVDEADVVERKEGACGTKSNS